MKKLFLASMVALAATAAVIAPTQAASVIIQSDDNNQYSPDDQSDNGEVIVTYADGGTARLALQNPTTWWPIERDYLVDDYQFRVPGPRPLRVDLATAKVRQGGAADGSHGAEQAVKGGSATVLGLKLDPRRKLKSLTVRARANDVVIGLLAATIQD